MPQAPTIPPLIEILLAIAILFGIVGCVIVFRILYRKWKSRTYGRRPSGLFTKQKKNLTEYEKRMLADKINETRSSNIKKSFAGTVSSKSMIFVTIGLIILVLLWILHVISQKFDPY